MNWQPFMNIIYNTLYYCLKWPGIFENSLEKKLKKNHVCIANSVQSFSGRSQKNLLSLIQYLLLPENSLGKKIK